MQGLGLERGHTVAKVSAFVGNTAIPRACPVRILRGAFHSTRNTGRASVTGTCAISPPRASLNTTNIVASPFGTLQRIEKQTSNHSDSTICRFDGVGCWLSKIGHLGFRQRASLFFSPILFFGLVSCRPSAEGT